MNNISTYTDKDLFQHITNGDEAAFTELFKRYSDNIYSYALKIVHSEFWAEEVVQTVFMQLWVGRANLNNIENTASYLFRIAANRSVDLLRKNKTEAKIRYYLNHQNLEVQNETENTFDYREIKKAYKQIINSLPEQRRRAFLLKNEEGLSYEEIAEILQISKHTVRNQIAKANQTIRTNLIDKLILIFILLFNIFF